MSHASVRGIVISLKTSTPHDGIARYKAREVCADASPHPSTQSEPYAVASFEGNLEGHASTCILLEGVLDVAADGGRPAIGVADIEANPKAWPEAVNKMTLDGKERILL